jgi:NAD(P)-dependent dehydrogenase (short-subunit alcohol dehydrogenase family)
MGSCYRLKDEVAIVVGAGSSGPGLSIGQAISRLFAQEGARVVLVDLYEERAAESQKLIAENGGESIAVAADISQPEAYNAIVAAAVSAYGTVSVLVNNAAFTPLLGVADTTPELFEKVMAVNLVGPFAMTRAVLPVMIERGGGSIVNIASVSAIRSSRGHQAAYASSKSGLLGLMVDVANEHGPNGIRVNTISPGMIDTPLRRATMREMGMDPDNYPFGPQSSLGHAGDPWDIARAALFLASDEARFITGVHLPVDGGLTTRQPS